MGTRVRDIRTGYHVYCLAFRLARPKNPSLDQLLEYPANMTRLRMIRLDASA